MNRPASQTTVTVSTCAAAACSAAALVALSLIDPDRAAEVLALLGFVAAMACGAVAVVLHAVGRSVTPIEQAYRLGYELGYSDGRRSERPIVVDCTDELARRARAAGNRR